MKYHQIRSLYWSTVILLAQLPILTYPSTTLISTNNSHSALESYIKFYFTSKENILLWIHFLLASGSLQWHFLNFTLYSSFMIIHKMNAFISINAFMNSCISRYSHAFCFYLTNITIQKISSVQKHCRCMNIPQFTMIFLFLWFYHMIQNECIYSFVLR